MFSAGNGLFFSRTEDEDELLREMVLVIGQKLPEPIWSSWANRALYFDDDGNWVGKNPRPEWSGQMMYDFTGSKTTMDDTEKGKLEKMLRSMVEFDPSKRATIDEVIASEWFVEYCLSS